MELHRSYAQIYENIVKNIMVCENYELANYVTKATYGDQAFAVDCTQYNCKIGDLYHNNNFYYVSEDGKEIQVEYIPTQEQKISILEYELNTQTEYNLDMDYRTSVLELGL